MDMFAADMPMRSLKENADFTESILLDQVTDLSVKCFGEDVVEEYAQLGKNGRLTWVWIDRSNLEYLESDDATVTSWGTDESESSQDPVLLGFMVTKYLQPKKGGQCLTIVYAAVAEPYRSRGIGKQLVQAAITLARERKDVGRVTLSALPTAIQFYERLGFKGFEGVLPKSETAIEGQVYMEYKAFGKMAKSKRK